MPPGPLTPPITPPTLPIMAFASTCCKAGPFPPLINVITFPWTTCSGPVEGRRDPDTGREFPLGIWPDVFWTFMACIVSIARLSWPSLMLTLRLVGSLSRRGLLLGSRLTLRLGSRLRGPKFDTDWALRNTLGLGPLSAPELDCCGTKKIGSPWKLFTFCLPMVVVTSVSLVEIGLLDRREQMISLGITWGVICTFELSNIFLLKQTLT